MRQRNSQKGDALISVLIACAIMLLLLSALVPSVFRVHQVSNEVTAASQLAAINLGESEYEKFGAFVNPIALSAVNLLYPASCSNAELLAGQQTVSPPGFTLQFNPGPIQTSFTCAATGSVQPPIGYQNYSISLTPQNRLQAQRNFFTCVGTACSNPAHSGLIEFAEDRAANENDPVYTVAAMGPSGGNGSNSGGGAESVQVWSAGLAVTLGQEVVRTAIVSGSNLICPTNLVYFNTTGHNGEDPASKTGSTDWQQLGSNVNCSQVSVSGSVALTVDGSVSIPNPLNSPITFQVGLGINSPGQYVSSSNAPGDTQILFVFTDNTTGQTSTCTVATPASPIPLQCTSAGGPITIHPSDSLSLSATGMFFNTPNGNPNLAIPSLNYSLN